MFKLSWRKRESSLWEYFEGSAAEVEDANELIAPANNKRMREDDMIDTGMSMMMKRFDDDDLGFDESKNLTAVIPDCIGCGKTNSVKIENYCPQISSACRQLKNQVF